MSKGFAGVPSADRYVLADATLPAVLSGETADAREGLVRRDIVIEHGRIGAVLPAGTAQAELPRLALDGGMVWPCFVELHTHLDKGHIWPRQANPNGTFDGALEAVLRDKETRWQAEDVARRMDFALRCAYAHGTALIRTHIDSAAPQHLISWPVLSDMRDRWAGRIDLQAVALFRADMILDRAYADELIGLLREHRGILGSVTAIGPELQEALDTLFRLAADNGLDLDLHVDETGDATVRSLAMIAETARRVRFPGRVTVGHCCSLAVQPDAEALRTLDLVAEAGLSVVSLPMCNMYLQDRTGGRTPRWRGVTLVHEFRARGVPVSIASDNTRDPFYAYGDLDAVEVLREGVRILHLDHPIDGWADVVTRMPADVMRRPDRGRIAAGLAADLVLFSARTWTEFLSRPQADRTVLRAGRAIDRSLPDYRELDDLMDSTR